MANLKNKPFITYFLIAVMVILFIVMTFDGGTTDPANLVKFGAQYDPYIIMGQYWRLFTPMFIHIGFTHLFVNMLTLYFIGMYVENLFGHLRFLAIFLVSGILGNLASFAFTNSVSAGASTAIFGLFGAFVMLGENFSDNLAIRQLAKNFALLILLNLGMDLFIPSIDIVGHIGGLIGGFLISYTVGTPVGKVTNLKRIVAFLTLAIVSYTLFVIGLNA